MGKDSNIVHQYFSRELEGAKILVRVNPLTYAGAEITVLPDGSTEMRELEFDADIFDDLKADGFIEANPLEFNLYLNGLA